MLSILTWLLQWSEPNSPLFAFPHVISSLSWSLDHQSDRWYPTLDYRDDSAFPSLIMHSHPAAKRRCLVVRGQWEEGQDLIYEITLLVASKWTALVPEY